MRITKLQQIDQKRWSNFTDSNHLGALNLTKPELISDTIEHLYKINLGSDDIVSLIEQYDTHYIDPNADGEYEWMLQGEDEYNVPIIGFQATPYDATQPAEPGKDFEQFCVIFGEKKFMKTEVIVGHNPDLYSLRVMSTPVAIGTNFAYMVQLVTGDPDLFIPQAELAEGKLFSGEYGLTEDTLSSEGTGMSFVSPFKMKNRISMIRKEAVVPGNMILKGKNAPMEYKFQDEKGVVHQRWLAKLDWEMLKQFRRDRARLIYGGKSTMKDDGTSSMTGTSGYKIKAGFGLLEQIAPTNVFHYNNFTADYLTDLALSLSYGKLPEDSRKFTLVTGEYGAIQFSKAIREFATSRIFNGDALGGITGGRHGSFTDTQFVKVATVNGIEFTVVIDAMKDNPVRNKERNSEGILKSSLEYELLDFGTAAGKPNIQKVATRGEEEAFGYIPGLRDPFSGSGGSNPKMMASKVDGYEIHRAYWGGVRIHNPMRIARILPA